MLFRVSSTLHPSPSLRTLHKKKLLFRASSTLHPHSTRFASCLSSVTATSHVSPSLVFPCRPKKHHTTTEACPLLLQSDLENNTLIKRVEGFDNKHNRPISALVGDRSPLRPRGRIESDSYNRIRLAISSRKSTPHHDFQALRPKQRGLVIYI